MPAIFRAHGALPQWIGERLLLPFTNAPQQHELSKLNQTLNCHPQPAPCR